MCSCFCRARCSPGPEYLPLLCVLLLLLLAFCRCLSCTAWQLLVGPSIQLCCGGKGAAAAAAKGAFLQELMLLDDHFGHQEAKQQHKLHTVQDHPAAASTHVCKVQHSIIRKELPLLLAMWLCALICYAYTALC